MLMVAASVMKQWSQRWISDATLASSNTGISYAKTAVRVNDYRAIQMNIDISAFRYFPPCFLQRLLLRAAIIRPTPPSRLPPRSLRTQLVPTSAPKTKARKVSSEAGVRNA